MPKYYLYNTTDKTYFQCEVNNYTNMTGVEHICLDSVFKESLQAVQIEFIGNSKSGNLLSFTNTDSKKGVINFDQKYREEIFNIPDKKLKATKSNPIVMAITKRVKVTNQSPAYYRLLLMGDYMLIILISGIIFIEDEKGEWFEMRRCLPAEAYIPKDKKYEGIYGAKECKNLLDSQDVFSKIPLNALGLIDVVTQLKRYYNEYAKGAEEKYYTGLVSSLSIKNSILFKEDVWERFVKREEDRKNRANRRQNKEKSNSSISGIVKEEKEKNIKEEKTELMDNIDEDYELYDDSDFSDDIDEYDFEECDYDDD